MPYVDPIYIIIFMFVGIAVVVGLMGLIMLRMVNLLKGIHDETRKTNTGPLTVVTTDPLLGRVLPATGESRRGSLQLERPE